MRGNDQDDFLEPLELDVLRRGDLVDGRYLILGVIGRGGFAEVYQATDEEGRAVALKVLREGVGDDEVNRRRWLNEIALQAKLEHQNLIGFIDCGPLAGVRSYLVMELIQGKTLRELLSAGERFPIDRALRIGIQICAGIHAAHRREFIHRDVKPENIFLLGTDGTDFVKVGDFGLARTQGVSAGTTGPLARRNICHPIKRAPIISRRATSICAGISGRSAA